MLVFLSSNNFKIIVVNVNKINSISYTNFHKKNRDFNT